MSLPPKFGRDVTLEEDVNLKQDVNLDNPFVEIHSPFNPLVHFE